MTDTDDHAVRRSLAVRLGLAVPDGASLELLDQMVAAEIVRRRWSLGPPTLQAQHGTRMCWERGCRRGECCVAANRDKGLEPRVGHLPELRLPWRKR